MVEVQLVCLLICVISTISIPPLWIYRRLRFEAFYYKFFELKLISKDKFEDLKMNYSTSYHKINLTNLTLPKAHEISEEKFDEINELGYDLFLKKSNRNLIACILLILICSLVLNYTD